MSTTVSVTLTRIEQLAYTETYEEVKLLLYRIVHNFARCYNLPFEELLSEAHLAFARALRRHAKAENRHKKFSTIVYFMTTMRLKTYVKKLNKHRNHLELNEEICGAQDHNSFMVALRSELTEDASLVVGLLTLEHEDMQALYRWHGNPKTPTAVRRILKDHLMDLGWEKPRIERTFGELRRIFS